MSCQIPSERTPRTRPPLGSRRLGFREVGETSEHFGFVDLGVEWRPDSFDFFLDRVPAERYSFLQRSFIT